MQVNLFIEILFVSVAEIFNFEENFELNVFSVLFSTFFENGILNIFRLQLLTAGPLTSKRRASIEFSNESE